MTRFRNYRLLAKFLDEAVHDFDDIDALAAYLSSAHGKPISPGMIAVMPDRYRVDPHDSLWNWPNTHIVIVDLRGVDIAGFTDGPL